MLGHLAGDRLDVSLGPQVKGTGVITFDTRISSLGTEITLSATAISP
ncbi:hypothetical protein G6O69_38065 [Pseudenhygromyxa sp. WMMC2535]|nr:hypothetical protein [Pseudenhygromyxa sp. WMMC2535]NVB43676.1 hypothetical protein [Pseudenhygromyxa sp. WMMC2535]